MDWALYLIFLIGLLILIFASKSESAKLIDQIPGPRPYPLVGNVFEYYSRRDDLLWKIQQRGKLYPHIYRVWHGPIPVVYIEVPDLLEKILGSTEHLSKGYFYKFLKPWLGEGLLTSTGEKWFKYRKLLTPTFHHKVLNKYLNAFHENTLILMEKLDLKAKTGEVFDVCRYLSLCTLDIICEAAMGIKISAQKDEDSPYVQSIYRILELTKNRMIRFWLHPDFVYYRTRQGRMYLKEVEILHGFTNRVIQERKARRLDRKESLIPLEDLEVGITRKATAFLDVLLKQGELKDGIDMTEGEIREQVDTFAFEGHDTTSTALSWTILLLGLHREIQEEAFEEQKRIFEDDIARQPNMRDVSKMRLLERIIKESSRLFPSIPFIGRVANGDIKYGEYTIPSGTSMVLNIYGMHRNPAIYEDPETFDPDRFLPENSVKRHPYALLPFSAGSRNCIGQKFALLEEKIILSALIRRYRIESAQTLAETNVMSDLLLKPKNGIRIRISKRDL